VIKGAAQWGDRKWLQLCGITKQEATLVSDLYCMDDNGDLLVNLYPVDKQEEVKGKRELARINGSKGGRPKKKPKENQQETNVGLILETNNEPTPQSVREGKGKERKEKESNKTDFQYPEYVDFENYLINTLPEINPEWTLERIKRVSKLQYETYQENNWKDGNGKQVKNWKTKAKNAISYKKPWNYGADNNAKSNPASNYARDLQSTNNYVMTL